jgi:caa(3)-type oxidase subunit IV
MSSHTHHDIQRDVRAYLFVFISLFILTAVTVGAAYLRLQHVVAIVLGLTIALVKGSMVALVFMHLKAERKLIYWALLLTFVFFVALMGLPLWSHFDRLDVGRWW